MDRALAIVAVAFVVAIILIYRVAAPYIATHYGLLGTAIWICAFLAAARVLDRR